MSKAEIDLRRKPRKTWTGRVIYERPIHRFTESDIRRISSRVLRDSPDGLVEAALRIVLAVVSLVLDEIGERTGTEGLARFLGRLLAGIFGAFRATRRVSEELLVAAAGALQPAVANTEAVVPAGGLAPDIIKEGAP
jgi:hypothetical protein